MPVPSNLSDLSPTAANNYPAATDTISTTDDYLRSHAAILAKVGDGTNALTTPALGAATATTINKLTITAPATGSTLTVADGKTLTASNTLTLTGTDGSSVAFGAGGTVAYQGGKLSQFAATSSAELAGVISDETGTGSLVFANTPTLVTPNIGAATGSSLSISGVGASTSMAFFGVTDFAALSSASREVHIQHDTASYLALGSSASAYGFLTHNVADDAMYVQYRGATNQIKLASNGLTTIGGTGNWGLTVNGALTAGTGTFTKADDYAVVVRSGNAANRTGIDLGRATTDGVLGVPAAEHFVVGATAGDIALNISSASKAFLVGVNSAQVAKFSSTGLSVTGTMFVGSSVYNGKVGFSINEAGDRYFVAKNDSTSASAYAGYVLNANGNSWGVRMGSSAANSNALEFVLDAVGTPATKMVLDASGNLLVGGTTNSGRLSVYSANTTAGTTISFFGRSDASGVAKVYNVDGAGFGNAAGCAFGVNSLISTGRSINAQGTINASGADYAEYERNNGLTITKGSIVGFKADGTLTLTFAEAVRFGIKSTNPSYVGGDTWGTEDVVGKKPEKTEEQTDEEFAPILAAWEAALEAERQKVDRIAYSGKVPCNVTGATAGDYIIAVENEDGSISGQYESNPDFAQYKLAVGRVNRVLEDGRCEVAVMVH